MNILAIDTSTEYLSLGLQVGSEQSYILEQVGNKQSNFVIPKIQELLKQNSIAIKDIDFVAYNQGPGSFTGLRIGLSVSLGITLGLHTKIIPIPAFALYAQSVLGKTKHNKVLIGLDARLNQMYLSGIELDTFKYFIEPQLLDPKEMNLEQNYDMLCIGSGFKVFNDVLNSNIKQLEFIDSTYPNALNMLQLVNDGIYAPVALEYADLLYLRNKVALTLEEQKQAKKCKNSF